MAHEHGLLCSIGSSTFHTVSGTTPPLFATNTLAALDTYSIGEVNRPESQALGPVSKTPGPDSQAVGSD